jgi:hypothetical protein
VVKKEETLFFDRINIPAAAKRTQRLTPPLIPPGIILIFSVGQRTLTYYDHFAGF